MGRRKVTVPVGKKKAPSKPPPAVKKRGRPPKELSRSDKINKGEEALGDTEF